MGIIIETEAFDNYTNHYCIRDCNNSTKSMTCIYNFTMEWYFVLSRNCFNCTNNLQDCFKPNCITASGLKRAVKVVNRMLPGPFIQVCQGDSVVVNLENDLDSYESTTIHWHGIKQRGTPHMDGVGGLTQCSISPLTKFQYVFNAFDAGTHFWHSHMAGQRADGIFGALIVREQNDFNSYTYDIDSKDHVIVVNEWLNPLFDSRKTSFLHGHDYCTDLYLNSILINGRGITYNMDFNAPISTFNVERGKRYRFRLIHAGVQFIPLKFSIDYHNLTIIATDGNPIQPVEVVSFTIVSGERIDFVITANQNIDSYWIRIKDTYNCQNASIFQTAILKYANSTNDSPRTNVNYQNSDPINQGLSINLAQKFPYDITTNLKISDLRTPLNNYFKSLTSAIKVNNNMQKIYLELGMNDVQNPKVYDDQTYALRYQYNNVFLSPQINAISYKMPNIPLFYQNRNYQLNMTCNQSNRQPVCSSNQTNFCSCIHLININLNDVVEFVVSSKDYYDHSFHLHGYSFFVLGMDTFSDSTFVNNIKKMDNLGLLNRNFLNPPIKDSILVPAYGYVILRIVANNPGFWLAHCHTDLHSDNGMAIIFKVGSDQDLPPPPLNWPQCGDYTNVNN